MATAVGVSILVVACIVTAAAVRREKQGPRTAFQREDYFRWIKELSNAGRWGATDQRGTLNLITPEKTKQAAALVKAGVSVSLCEVQIPNGDDKSGVYTGTPYGMTMHLQDWEKASQQEYASPPPEDLALSGHGGRCHIDAMAHMFYKGQAYNGITPRDVTDKGALKGGAEQMHDGIVTRGVLVDVPRLKGVPYLNLDTRVTVADLENWEKQAHVTVSPGDALFIRIGHWTRRRATGDRRPRGATGFDPAVIPWLKKRGVAVLGSEASHDAVPSEYDLGPLPVHWFATAVLGTPLMDYLDLDPLGEVAARQRRWEFLVTLAPLPIQGSTGSPINPIAVF